MHKSDFEIFNSNDGLVYLDNAATSQMPNQVLDKITEYYKGYKSNIDRGQYGIAAKATDEYEAARLKVAKFIKADKEEIIFTSGATDSANKLVMMFDKYLAPQISNGRTEVVVPSTVHNSDLLPLQEFAIRNNLKIVYGMENISDKTLIVSHMYASNVTGEVYDVQGIFKKAKSFNAFTICDATAAAGHININVEDSNIDALYFSAHKMCGPSGVGVLYISRGIMRDLYPVSVGGGMVWQVGEQKSEYRSDAKRYEPGTPNISGVIGLGASIDYINSIGIVSIRESVENVIRYGLVELGKLESASKLKLYVARDAKNNVGIISFELYAIRDGKRIVIHPHDVAEILARENIAVRAGHHCAQTFMSASSVDALTRASFYFYNSKEDVNRLILGLEKVIEVFSK